MSVKHPIIAVTGSSGAGTTTVMKSFMHIFRREHINAQIVEGDAFHRYDRNGMRAAMQERERDGVPNFSHFGPEANLLEELETLFTRYGENGSGQLRHYVHDAGEAQLYKQDGGTFTPWEDVAPGTDLMFYEGLHGAAVTDKVDIARHADLLIGVVPIINLEWIQKLHRDQTMRGYTHEAVVDT
ncbi:MAG TPA: phosphoribulokinase, partial [Paraburkholderia sp.]|nr:phosphoribulokinase [Paraburkholderia sp.]